MLGSTVSFSISSAPRPSALAPSRANPATALTQTAANISPLQKTRTDKAISNIIAIISGMSEKGSAPASRQERVDQAVAAYIENATPDADDALAAARRHLDGMEIPASHQSFAAAVRSGQIKIERAGDNGVTTSKDVTLQFDTGGNQVGTAVAYHGSDKALAWLQQKMGVSDGTTPHWGTDQATGRQANWMAIGNDYFYMTW
jgi:hypothetical protein